MQDKSREAIIVSAAKNGNEMAFEELYNLYYQKIYALCLTTLKSTTDAEDCLQTTFMSAWQNIDKLEDNSAFNTWIQRIALNSAYSLLRKRNANISFEEDIEAVDDEESDDELFIPQVYAERQDLNARLKQIIDNLSDVQRQTITLYYFGELTVEEIASVMSCSVGTVKSRLYLARKSVKIEIEEQERQSGQKFFGVVTLPVLPFPQLFVSQVKKTSISSGAASTIFTNVARNLGKTVIGARNAALASTTAKTGVTASKAVATATKVVAAGTKAAFVKAVAITSAAVIAVGAAIGTGVYIVNKNTDEKNDTETGAKDSYTGEPESEEKLRGILEDETDKEILHFYYEDFDSDGEYEAFAVAGTDNSTEIDEGWYNNADVWFIKNGTASKVKENIYGYPNGVLKDKKYSFLSLEKSARGSGSLSYVFGVKDGKPVEMNVSEEYGDFVRDENYTYKGYQSDFSKGYHDYIYTYFTFDETDFEFKESDDIICPDFIGKTKEEIQFSAESNTFVIDFVDRVTEDESQVGKAIDQTPAKGRILKKGAKIKVFIGVPKE